MKATITVDIMVILDITVKGGQQPGANNIERKNISQ